MELFNGRAFKPTDWSTEGLRIVRIKNLNDERAPFNHCNFQVEERRLIHDDDFLISWSGTPGTSFGAFIWKRGKAVLNQHIFRCELSSPELSKPYMRLAVNSRLDELISKAHGGVGLQHVTKPTLEHLPLPLPPLAEQRRIVAKVEELMGLCDALEAAQQERETVRTRLRTSALHRLTAPETDSRSAAFVFRHFPRITAAIEDLTPLRDLVSWMGVEGSLSSGGRDFWPTDRFENVVELQGGVTNGRNLTGEKTVELPYLRVANVQRGHLALDVMKRIEIRERESEKYALRTGDLVITEGGDWDKVGRTAVWCEEIKPCIHQNHVFRARPDPKRLWPEWGMLALNSRRGRDYFADASKQTTNLASINMSQLRRFPIPLPPLAEQRRIVAKVDELMAVLDALEAALTTARTAAEKLLAGTTARLQAG